MNEITLHPKEMKSKSALRTILEKALDGKTLVVTKPTPLSERDPVKATSMKKLYSKIKWDKLTGKEG